MLIFRKNKLKKDLIKENRMLNIVVIIYSILGILIVAALFWLTNSPYDPVARCMMYYPKQFGGKFPSGIYVQDNYYCVWTKNTGQDYIDYIDYHEVCHNLVYWDREHFCSDKAIGDNLYGLCPWSYIKNVSKNI